MKASHIVKRIAKSNSLYGNCAQLIINNEELSEQFLKECYDQISKFPGDMEDYFDSDVLNDIIKFCKQ